MTSICFFLLNRSHCGALSRQSAGPEKEGGCSQTVCVCPLFVRSCKPDQATACWPGGGTHISNCRVKSQCYCNINITISRFIFLFFKRLTWTNISNLIKLFKFPPEKNYFFPFCSIFVSVGRRRGGRVGRQIWDLYFCQRPWKNRQVFSVLYK